MTISQRLLYISGYAAADAPGIHVFTFDAPSASLMARWSFPGIVNPSFIVVHPNGRWLYAVSETSQQQDGVSGTVWSLALPDTMGEPQVLSQQMSGGDWPCHLALDATGRWLLVSNYASGSVGVLPILENGALGEMSDLVQHHGSGPNAERQEGPHAHSTIFAPDNHFVLVADLGIDQIVVYAFDSANGQLRRHGQAHARPGSGPRHMTFDSTGQRLYVAHELDNTVVVYDYAAEHGELTMRQRIETLPPGAPENTVADIHLSPQGDRLYVSNRGHDSIAVFTVAKDGGLERIAIEPCGGHWPRNFAVAPGGEFLLVANQYSNEITVLPVLEKEAALGEPRTRVVVPGASCVQFATS